MQHKPNGTIHRTVTLLQNALHDLGAAVETPRVERIGIAINRGMSATQRSFHTPEHIFDLADPSDPHVTLAALFHDLVYYQVDSGFSADIAPLLDPYVKITPEGVQIKDPIPQDARAVWGCMAIFGFQPGQKLSIFGGLNEFLSALVMDLWLVDAVTDVDLLIASACIEATIPFRRAASDGTQPAEALRNRVRSINESFALGLAQDRIDAVIRTAVRFANKDVCNFAEADVGRFLDNTWKLLPETNPELRLRGHYTIRSYRTALKKMEGFLCGLSPDCVFQRFDTEPSEAKFLALRDAARVNLQTACRYLGIKLLTAGILEALAELSGGDVPVSYFMGEIDPENATRQLSDYLPITPPYPDSSPKSDVDHLMAHGRAGRSPFDLQNSPLSLFVHRSLAGEQFEAGARAAAAEFFNGTLSPHDFLTGLPHGMVAAVAAAAAEIAFTRRDALLEIASAFGGR